MLTRLGFISIFAAIGTAAPAAVFEFTGAVSTVDFGSLSDAPTIGEEVTFRIEIPNDPSRRILDEDPSGTDSLLPFITISTAGGLSAAVRNVGFGGSFSISPTVYSVSSYGPGICCVSFPTWDENLHSAGFRFDTFAFSDLTNPTLGELVQALTDSSSVSGRFRAETQDRNTFEFGSFTATFDTDLEIAPVPLPMSASFLLLSLGAFGLARRFTDQS